MSSLKTKKVTRDNSPCKDKRGSPIRSPIDETPIVVNGNVRTPSPDRKLLSKQNSPALIRAESPKNKIVVKNIIPSPIKKREVVVTKSKPKKEIIAPIRTKKEEQVEVQKEVIAPKRREITPIIKKVISPVKKRDLSPEATKKISPPMKTEVKTSPIKKRDKSPEPIKKREDNLEPVKKISPSNKTSPIKKRDLSAEATKKISPHKKTEESVEVKTSPINMRDTSIEPVMKKVVKREQPSQSTEVKRKVTPQAKVRDKSSEVKRKVKEQTSEEVPRRRKDISPEVRKVEITSPSVRAKKSLMETASRRRISSPSRSVVKQPETTTPSRVISLNKEKKVTPDIQRKPPIIQRKAIKVSEEEDSYSDREPNSPQIRQSSPILIKSNTNRVVASPIGFNKEELQPGLAASIPVNTPSAVVAGPVKPDYRSMTEEEKEHYRNEFTVKLSILRRSQQGYGFADFPAGASLDTIHEIYSGYVKQVVVALNCSQWKIYLVIMFLGLEAFGTKVLGLNMSGFTLSQLANITKYDTLLTEIGEKYYVAGTSSWSPEVKLCFMGITSAITFVAINYLASYVGGDAARSTIQAAVDALMTGTFTQSNANSLPAGVPPPTGAAQPPPAVAVPGGGFDLMGMLGSFMGGGGAAGGGGIGDIIAKVGTAFINNGANPTSAKVEANAAAVGSAPRRKPKFRAPSNK